MPELAPVIQISRAAYLDESKLEQADPDGDWLRIEPGRPLSLVVYSTRRSPATLTIDAYDGGLVPASLGPFPGRGSVVIPPGKARPHGRKPQTSVTWLGPFGEPGMLRFTYYPDAAGIRLAVIAHTEEDDGS